MSEKFNGMQNTVIDYLINSYRNYGDKIAIVYNGKTVTYKELYNTILKIAGIICEKTGGEECIGKGQLL